MARKRSAEKGQGALEYILLVAGAILFVIIVVSIIRSQVLQQQGNQTQTQAAGFFDFLNETKEQLISGNYSTPTAPTATPVPSPGFFFDTNETDFATGALYNTSVSGSGSAAKVALWEATAGSAYGSGVATSNIVAYWKFDNSSAYGESGTLAYDYSGQGKNATMPSGTYVDGVFGKALNFSRSTLDDKVTAAIGGATGFQIDGNFSFSAWVRLTYLVGDVTRYFTIFTLLGDNPWFGIEGYSMTSRILELYQVQSDQDEYFPSNVWKYVTLTWNNDASTANIYRDGYNQYVPSSTPYGTPTPTFMPTPDVLTVVIGEGDYTPNPYPTTEPSVEGWEGQIDEVVFYNKTLSDSEVLSTYYDSAARKGAFERIFDAGAAASWQFLNWSAPVAYRREPTVETGPAGMLGYWKFDNASAYGESGTLAYDYSGGGKNATMSQPADYASGIFGKSAYFRSSAYGDMANVSLDSPSSDYTVEAWVNPQTGGVDDTYYLIQDFGPNEEVYFSLYDVGPGLQLTLYRVRDSDTVYVRPFVWSHVAYTWNGSAYTIYIDGSVVGSRFTSLLSGVGMWIGDCPAHTSEGMEGYLDNVIIYNRSLSETELRAHYLEGMLNLTMQVATSPDNSTWSGWSGPFLANQSSGVWLSIAVSRYLKYRASFSAEDGVILDAAARPVLESVFVNYTA